MFGDGVEIKCGRAFVAPFVGDGVNSCVHSAKDGLLFGREKDICGVVFCQVGGEHPFPGDFEADPFEVGDLFGSGEG